LVETRATALVTDPVTNEVLGVQAESKGAKVYIKARRGVNISTGGYSQNKEFCKNFCPEAVDAFGGFTASDTADGHLMGMAIGAAALNLSQTLLDVSLLSGAIMVNYGGRRFTDETTYRVKGEVQNGQRNALAWQIYDSAIKGTSTLAPNESATIAELAGKIGVDPTVLEDTINFYNKSIATGKDLEFGRTRRDTQKRPPTETAPTPERTMLPIKTPPFYALKMGPFTNGTITMGGLKVNTKAQVIDVYGKVIPRLYASGTAMGGLMGQMYVGSGQAISISLNFGRIAGKTAAGEKPWS
jgi:succinate dehydrogenase/fumarate reductase flavoprotein subunit